VYRVINRNLYKQGYLTNIMATEQPEDKQ